MGKGSTEQDAAGKLSSCGRPDWEEALTQAVGRLQFCVISEGVSRIIKKRRENTKVKGEFKTRHNFCLGKLLMYKLKDDNNVKINLSI